LLAFVLAVVASRVVGETGIPPIGAIGKIAQLSFGVAAPANPTLNLMGANVTGGAAGQCADLLDDLRAGQLLGTEPGRQVLAQCFGILVGSLVGSLAYRLLIPDPRSMLLTAEWPAPAVATWKAVAEVMSSGVAGIPEGGLAAMGVAAILGVAVSVADVRLPARLARWLPSGPALGLAFVIPAWISLSMALGAVAAAAAARIAPGWASRFVLALAAGFVAGESLAGIASAMSAFAGADHHVPGIFSSRRCRLVPPDIPGRADRGAGGCLACDRRRPEHAGGSAHRVRQDPDGLHDRHRLAGASGAGTGRPPA
jgi:uncharacterized oligopeptide transporter (OPT) family protein